MFGLFKKKEKQGSCGAGSCGSGAKMEKSSCSVDAKPKETGCCGGGHHHHHQQKDEGDCTNPKGGCC